MQATNLKNIHDQSANYDEQGTSQNTNSQLATDKLKAIGEEIASWFLVVSVVTVLIQFFSNLQ